MAISDFIIDLRKETLRAKLSTAQVSVEAFKKALANERGRQVGCLGDIPFFVSDKAIQTVQSASWSGSSNIAQHERRLNDALVEPVGRKADGFEFEITLSRFLCVDPFEAVNRLWEYIRDFEPVVLILGAKTYGKYRWLIEDLDFDITHFDPEGNAAQIKAKVSLIEYTKGGDIYAGTGVKR